MSPVTISEEATGLLRARMASSGFASPFARITMQGSGGDARRAGGDDVDWTIQRRDLWTLVIAGDQEFADGDPRVAVVDGLRFVCDYFPIRFEVSVKDGRFRVAAAA